MKHIFLLLLPIFSSLAAQNPGCDVPASVVDFYRDDAAQLSVRLMNQSVNLKDSVFIPAAIHKSVSRALYAVYNAQQYPQRDTVVECRGIHAFPFPSPYLINLKVSVSLPWVENLRQRIFPTGYDALDQLMSYYGLLPYQYFVSSSGILFTLKAKNALNMTALAPIMQQLSQVDQVWVDTPIGDGDDIRIKGDVNNSYQLTYIAGWGDCPAGCISERAWHFRANADCSVDYLGVTGDKIDFLFNCSNTFKCFTEPLCMKWMRDTIKALQEPFPMLYQTKLSRYAQFGEIVYMITIIVGIDYEIHYFFTCDGYFIGKCETSLIGVDCPSPLFLKYFEATEVWNSTQPFPTPAECGITPTLNPDKGSMEALLSPNPASGQIVLSARSETGFRCGLYDGQGKLIRQTTFPRGEIREALDLSGIAPGFYLARLEADGKFRVLKFVVEQ